MNEAPVFEAAARGLVLGGMVVALVFAAVFARKLLRLARRLFQASAETVTPRNIGRATSYVERKATKALDEFRAGRRAP